MIDGFAPYPGFIPGDGDEPGVSLSLDNPLRIDGTRTQLDSADGRLPKAAADAFLIDGASTLERQALGSAHDGSDQECNLKHEADLVPEGQRDHA